MEENNKLIAEFLGYKIENKKFQSLEYHSSNESSWVWNEGEIVTLNGNEVSDDSQEPYFSLEDLPFNSDWNYLMQAVDVIEECDIVASFQIEQPTIYIWASSESDSFEDIEVDIFDKTKIEAVYEAVVKFINFYNKQEEE